VLDMAGMAQQAGTVVSAVMLGAIAGSGLLPFERAHFEAAIGQGAQAAASLRGFALAFDAVTPRANGPKWPRRCCPKLRSLLC
jgi:indolepyruvate ferredoxin oxidoreductase, beta subunit